MRVQSVNNTNFGMSVSISPKAKEMLERSLTPKGAKQLKEIVSAEKSNPINVHVTTEQRRSGIATIPVEHWYKYDCLVVQTEDKSFEPGIMDLFSTSRAMISAIKKGVKYARRIANNREGLKDIPEK